MPLQKAEQQQIFKSLQGCFNNNNKVVTGQRDRTEQQKAPPNLPFSLAYIDKEVVEKSTMHCRN